MFIPIGLEENEVRRVPWITWTIISLNVLIFTGLWLAEQRAGGRERANEQGKAAVEYLLQHPYLKAPAELDALFDDEDRHQIEQRSRAIAHAGRTPADWEIARQQAKLDEMVASFFAALRDTPISRWGFVPGKPRAINLLTSMFAHGGWLHLIGNMFFLFLTGPFIEDAYGRVLYPILYLLSGFAADGVHAVHNPGSLAPTVGASGAIAGVMGAFLVRYATRRIVFYWMPLFPLPWLARRIRVPAFLYLPFWFLGQVLLSNMSGEQSGVAVWAHIGGFLFGFVTALLIAAFGIERKYIQPAIERQVGGPENADLLRAIQAGARGDLAEARRATGRVLAQDPGNLDARRYAYHVAVDSGDPAEIGAQASRLLEAYLQHGENELARELLHDVAGATPGPLPPRFLLRAGDFLGRQGDAPGALAMYERLLESHPGDPAGVRALVQSADLRVRAGDSRGARQDLLRAQSHPAYGPEWKEVVDAKLSALDLPKTPATTGGYRGSRPPR
jgi:membrane associated rhomboid family serine protease